MTSEHFRNTAIVMMVSTLIAALLLLAAVRANSAPALSYSPQPVRAGVETTFTAPDGSCVPGGCSYTWSWSFKSGNRTVTGGQMGRGETITYTFDAFAASKPYVTVLVVVSEGRLGYRNQAQTSFKVEP